MQPWRYLKRSMSHFFAGSCGAGLLPSLPAVVVVGSALSPKPRFRIESGAMRFLFLEYQSPILYVYSLLVDVPVPLHPTLQVILAQLPTSVIVDSSMTTQAFQVLFHDGLAFCFVVEREGTSFGWDGFGGDLAAACIEITGSEISSSSLCSVHTYQDFRRSTCCAVWRLQESVAGESR